MESRGVSLSFRLMRTTSGEEKGSAWGLVGLGVTNDDNDIPNEPMNGCVGGWVGGQQVMNYITSCGSSGWVERARREENQNCAGTSWTGRGCRSKQIFRTIEGFCFCVHTDMSEASHTYIVLQKTAQYWQTDFRIEKISACLKSRHANFTAAAPNPSICSFRVCVCSLSPSQRSGGFICSVVQQISTALYSE